MKQSKRKTERERERERERKRQRQRETETERDQPRCVVRGIYKKKDRNSRHYRSTVRELVCKRRLGVLGPICEKSYVQNERIPQTHRNEMKTVKMETTSEHAIGGLYVGTKIVFVFAFVGHNVTHLRTANP